VKQVLPNIVTPINALGSGASGRRVRIPLGGGPVVVVDGNGVPTADAVPAGCPTSVSPILFNYFREWYIGCTANFTTATTSATAASNTILLRRGNPPGPIVGGNERTWEGNTITCESGANNRAPGSNGPIRGYPALAASSGGANAFGLLGPDCYLEYTFESVDATTGTASCATWIVGDPISPDR
jgi:hypothetical protein